MPSVSEAPARESEPSFARGAAIGRYLVLELVGKGGMGEVYAAYDPELDRKVAIKLLRTRGGPYTVGADARTRLMREAQAIAKVTHPNVIVVYDVGTFEDRVFIAMEFVDGHTVTYWMHAQTRPWVDTLTLFVAAGRGLAAAHEKQLIHRDFKPDNVMIRADGQVRVMDFGLVRSVDRSMTWRPAEPPIVADDAEIGSTRVLGAPAAAADPPVPSGAATPGDAADLDLTRTGAMLGTPAYMAPEQFMGGPIDARTDQFSFCVALYEALYGQRPFAGETLFGLTASVVQGMIQEAPAGSIVPPWLRRVLLRGLAVKPDDRWPSMKALLDELENNRLVVDRRRFGAAAAAKLAGIWEVPEPGHPIETAARTEMRAAFLATGKLYAATAFDSASGILDRYASSWANMYTDALEATHVRQEQSAEILDLRVGFLNEALDGLKALCRVFRQAKAEVVENAVNAATALPRIERCTDIELLRAVVKPPSDPDARAAVDRLRTQLAKVRTLSNVGRITEGLKAIKPLEQAARKVGYGPLLAEALLLAGNLHIERRNLKAAAAACEEAVWTAELARHDEVVAEATTQLVAIASDALKFDAAEIWACHAETILRRIGGHDQLWGWLFNNKGMMRQRQGLLDDAFENVKLAVSHKEKACGADSPDLALSLGNLAYYLGEKGDFSQAILYAEKSVRIMEATEGAEHPRTAVLLMNYSEYLNQTGRFKEARGISRRALAIVDKESDPDGLLVTTALMALGMSYLGESSTDEAIPLIERVVKSRETHDNDLSRLGEAHFALARALFTERRDLPRAHAMATRARDEYARASATASVTRALEQIDAFLPRLQEAPPSL